MLNNHLANSQSESDTILIDIIFDVKHVKHLPDAPRVLQPYALITDRDLQSLNARPVILISDQGRIGIKAPSFDEDDSLVGVFDTVLNKVAEDLLKSRTVHVHL